MRVLTGAYDLLTIATNTHTMSYADMTPREAVCFAEGGNVFSKQFLDEWVVTSKFFSSHSRENTLEDAKSYAKYMRSEGYTVKRKSFYIGVSVTAIKKRDNGKL